LRAKSQTRRTLERPRPEYEDNIKIIIEIYYVSVLSGFNGLGMGFNDGVL
jgi:hypothetical protein